MTFIFNSSESDASDQETGFEGRRWAVQFTATRGEMTATVKMGAIGDTWEDACQFVRNHCAGQYDSIGEIGEIAEIFPHATAPYEESDQGAGAGVLRVPVGSLVPGNSVHVCLDLETLGLRDGSIIATVGAVIFTLDGVIDTFYRRVDVFHAIDNTELEIDGSTLRWWCQQSPAALAEVFDPNLDREEITVVLKALKQFVDNYKAKEKAKNVVAWSRHVFDQRIMEAACVALGIEPAIRHSCFRDISDWLKVLDPAKEWMPPRVEEDKHHALLDALHDVEWFLGSLREVGISPAASGKVGRFAGERGKV